MTRSSPPREPTPSPASCPSCSPSISCWAIRPRECTDEQPSGQLEACTLATRAVRSGDRWPPADGGRRFGLVGQGLVAPAEAHLRQLGPAGGPRQLPRSHRPEQQPHRLQQDASGRHRPPVRRRQRPDAALPRDREMEPLRQLVRVGARSAGRRLLEHRLHVDVLRQPHRAERREHTLRLEPGLPDGPPLQRDRDGRHARRLRDERRFRQRRQHHPGGGAGHGHGNDRRRRQLRAPEQSPGRSAGLVLPGHGSRGLLHGRGLGPDDVLGELPDGVQQGKPLRRPGPPAHHLPRRRRGDPALDQRRHRQLLAERRGREHRKSRQRGEHRRRRVALPRRTLERGGGCRRGLRRRGQREHRGRPDPGHSRSHRDRHPGRDRRRGRQQRRRRGRRGHLGGAAGRDPRLEGAALGQLDQGAEQVDARRRLRPLRPRGGALLRSRCHRTGGRDDHRQRAEPLRHPLQHRNRRRHRPLHRRRGRHRRRPRGRRQPRPGAGVLQRRGRRRQQQDDRGQQSGRPDVPARGDAGARKGTRRRVLPGPCERHDPRRDEGLRRLQPLRDRAAGADLGATNRRRPRGAAAPAAPVGRALDRSCASRRLDGLQPDLRPARVSLEFGRWRRHGR